MDQYGHILDLNQALGKTRGIQNAGGAPAKGFGMAGKLGGMVTGGNVPATAALSGGLFAAGKPFMGLGAATTILNNPGAMSSVARIGAEALPGVAKAAAVSAIGGVSSLFNDLTSNPQSFGKYAAPLLQAAQTGGSQGVAATHFILGTTNPEYADMMRKRQEQSDERPRTQD